MNIFQTGSLGWEAAPEQPRSPVKVSTRTLGHAIEEALMGSFTRAALEVVLSEELGLTWKYDHTTPDDPGLTKRGLVDGYISGWQVSQLATFARRLDAEVDIGEHLLAELRDLLDAYERGGGVAGPTKNLIFAANGPKPEIVLRDAISNDIQIVKKRRALPGLRAAGPVRGAPLRSPGRVVAGQGEHPGRDRRPPGWSSPTPAPPGLARQPGRASGAGDLRPPLQCLLRHPCAHSAGVPALRPLRPADTARIRGRGAACTPAMDFLLLFSDRQRVVIEVDGKQQHYADGDAASPRLYSEMVAEDRRLRLSGYEVYRFGGYELTRHGSSAAVVEDFFQELADRMK